MLWGQAFADEQVAIEKKRTGGLADHEGLWRQALAQSATERARRFQRFVREHRQWSGSPTCGWTVSGRAANELIRDA